MAAQAVHQPAADMEQKHEYVRRWLGRVFGEESIPEYEINSQTVELLYQLARENEERERQAELLTADLLQKTEEYAAETARVKGVLGWVGVKMEDLTPAAQGYLKTLAGIAIALDLKDCSDTSLCLSLTELSRQLSADAVRRKEREGEGERAQEEVRRALLRQTNHKSALSELSAQAEVKAPVISKRKKEGEFLRQKAEQYQKLVASMKEQLKQSGYEPSLSHSALQQRAWELEELQSQLGPLQNQLASYQDLPPDLDLAKVKVEEARQELAKLEAELNRTVDLVHAEK